MISNEEIEDLLISIRDIKNQHIDRYKFLLNDLDELDAYHGNERRKSKVNYLNVCDYTLWRGIQ